MAAMVRPAAEPAAFGPAAVLVDPESDGHAILSRIARRVGSPRGVGGAWYRPPMRTAPLAAVALSSLLSACASPIVGTWQGQAPAADAPLTFGRVSFVGDGTFTADASYAADGQVQNRVQSGVWSAKGESVTIDGSREYRFRREGDTLTFTDPKTGRSMSLTRVPPVGTALRPS
jgi:hypothetical protein